MGHGGPLSQNFAAAAAIYSALRNKHIATEVLAGAPARTFLAGAVGLEYTENPGAFLGLGALVAGVRARRPVLAWRRSFGLAVVTALWRRLAHTPGAVFGLALFAAGSLSNLVNRGRLWQRGRFPGRRHRPGAHRHLQRRGRGRLRWRRVGRGLRPPRNAPREPRRARLTTTASAEACGAGPRARRPPPSDVRAECAGPGGRTGGRR